MIVHIANFTRLPRDKALAVRQRAQVIDGTHAYITEEALKEIDAGILVTPEVELSTLMEREHESPLLGTQLEAFFAKHGLDKAAKVWERWMKIDCGCVWRARKLDKLHAMFRTIKEKITGGG